MDHLSWIDKLHEHQTIEELIGFLNRLGIKGIRGSDTQNPIAEYLNERTNRDVEATYWGECIIGGDTYGLSTLIQRFLVDFHEGQYPGLQRISS